MAVFEQVAQPEHVQEFKTILDAGGVVSDREHGPTPVSLVDDMFRGSEGFGPVILARP